MGKSSVKNLLIRLFGKVCFIAKLGWRKIIGNKRGQKEDGEKEKKSLKHGEELTYHHIVERSMSYQDNRGETIENGALLSEENHRWFNEQSASDKTRMNKSFQEYKISILKQNNLLNEFGFFPIPSKKLLKRKERKEEKRPKKGEIDLGPIEEELPNEELSNDKPLIVNSIDGYKMVFTQKGNEFARRKFTGENYNIETDYSVNEKESWKDGCNTLPEKKIKKKLKKLKKIKKAKKEEKAKEEKDLRDKSKVEKDFRDKLKVDVNYNYEEYKQYLDEGNLEETIGEKKGLSEKMSSILGER